MPRVKKIDHIAIATKSLSQSLEFFEKQLGLVCDKIEELQDRGIRVAFLAIGDTRLEIIEPLHDKSEISSFLANRGPGLHHIAFESFDVKNDMKVMSHDGVQFTTKEASKGAHGAEVAFIHPRSTQGVLIELTKPSQS